MMKLHKIFFAILLAAVIAPLILGAGWGTRAPTVVNAGNGQPDVHKYSSNKRMVYINGTIIALAPQEFGSRADRSFRSTDTGNTWTEIDSFAQYSGCIITGKDSLVYHIWGDFDNDSMHWNYYKYNKATPLNLPRKHLYTHADLSNTGNGSQYRETSCAVDSIGTIYAITDWAPAATPTHNQVFAFRLRDTVTGWEGPYTISTNTNSADLYPQIEVDVDNKPIATYSAGVFAGIDQGGYFCRSQDSAVTWSCSKFDSLDANSRDWTNLSPLAYAKDTIIIFGQRGNGSGGSQWGLYKRMSTNNGSTWAALDSMERTCGYADPSAAVDSMGRVYVAYRSNHNVAGTLNGTNCGDSSRAKIGWFNPRTASAFTPIDSAFPATYFQVGTRVNTRYQNWFNYGGYLMWTWMGYSDLTGTNRPLFFDVNDTVHIMSTHVSTKRASRHIRLLLGVN